MTNVKPPIAVCVKSIKGFARLALALTDSPTLLWRFKYKAKIYLGTFSVYMSWKSDIPLFTYITLNEPGAPFLAYKADSDKEECFFTDNVEDTRYVFAPIIDLKVPSTLFKHALEKKWPHPENPLPIELENLYSLMRLLYLISSKDLTFFPVWYFKRGKVNILGVCVPFEHYYEANALPVFFYVKMKKPPEGSFLRYATSRLSGESWEYSSSTGDMKYFYAKIIEVDDMPLLSR